MGKYVEGYDLCQKIKNRTEKLAGKLKLSKVLEKSWTYLIVDFITKLLVVVGKDAILVICNRLSKMTYFVATTERMSVERLTRLFRDNIWKLHRLPESVVSDRGPQFAAELMKISQMRYSLVVILELNSVSEVQYKGMMTDRWWKVSTGIIDVIKSKV